MITTAPSENETSDQIGPPIELAPAIAKSHFYNDITAGIFSICINFLMILVVTTRISTATKVFRKFMCASKCFEILFSASYIMTVPVFTSISVHKNFTALMIVNTGGQINFIWSQIFLSAALILLTQQIFLAPWLYYIRYAQVCRKHGVQCIDVLIIVVTNSTLQLVTSVCLCYASIPTESDVDFLLATANKFTGTNPAFLLLSYEKSIETFKEHIIQILSIVSALGYVFSLILSIFVMIFCTIKINLKVRESENTSKNLLALQKKVNILLLTQFFCPLIFIQIPFYYSVLGPIAGLSQGLPTDLLPLLFAWSPAVNTLVVFILNSEIRNAIIRRQRLTATSDVRRSVV